MTRNEERAPPTGFMDGPTHIFPVRVYYEDTDAGGIVYHANYLRFAERARSELLRMFSAGNRGLLDGHDLAFVARHCVLDYIAPARLDDALEIHSRIIELRAASLRLTQIVKRAAEDLVRTEIRLACVGAGGRAARMPRSARDALAELVGLAS